ncbi:LCCL domain [Trinorchestia longiramus]|nr:LCCL domain [Trinorchestia longiramus]
MARQKHVRLLLVGTLMLVSAVVQSFAQTSCDKKFKDGYTSGTFTHLCLAACTAWQNKSYSQIPTGTFAYDQFSPVCLSALHAGVLKAGQQKSVSYYAAAATHDFVGSIQNRVLANSGIMTSGDPAFSFVTEHNPEIPGKTSIIIY